MFSSNTYEMIKLRMLSNLTDNIDNREGSFANNIMSPLALELSKAYWNMSDILNLAFLENNTLDMLDLKASEWGLARKLGNKANGEILFEGEGSIDNGSILEHNDLRFVMLNDVTIGEDDDIGYVEALEEGKKYNLVKGTQLTLLDNKNIKVTINKTFENGTDTESDEDFLNRYYSYIRKTRTSGNANDYYNWALEVQGVGDAKVYPTWNGAGTVKVVICNNEKKVADTPLVNTVKEHIEVVRPIGANVTVESVVEKLININVKLVIRDGYSLDSIKEIIISKITTYLHDSAFESEYISIARLGNIILDVEGVRDYQNFTLNGSSSNVELQDNEVPVLGTMVIN